MTGRSKVGLSEFTRSTGTILTIKQLLNSAFLSYEELWRSQRVLSASTYRLDANLRTMRGGITLFMGCLCQKWKPLEPTPAIK